MCTSVGTTQIRPPPQKKIHLIVNFSRQSEELPSPGWPVVTRFNLCGQVFGIFLIANFCGSAQLTVGATFPASSALFKGLEQA